MGANASGSLNTRGYSESLSQEQLPSYHHLTHCGSFNQKFFEAGPRAHKLLELHYGLGVSNCDLLSLDRRNFFLGMLMKSNKDGLPRTRGINLCVALDVSGSMNSPLNHTQSTLETRTSLAKKALELLFTKLEGNDIFSLVVFNSKAETVIESSYVRDLERQKVRAAINRQFPAGGTTIRSGFNLSVLQIKKHQAELTNYENRIVMLTDVEDNSFENEKLLIEDIASSDISVTVVGISKDFKSSTCEKLKNIRGFNYLCAINNEDLQTYMVDRFSYTFFPCVSNISISISSPGISAVKVYGTPDEEIHYQKTGNQFIITKMPTMFPSELIKSQSDQNGVLSLGGLILVKFAPLDPEQLPTVDLKIRLDYQDMQGGAFHEQYAINEKVSAEQYFSNRAVEEGAAIFYYTESIRAMLKVMNDTKVSPQLRQLYVENLKKLADFCPKQKLEQLKKLSDIVSKPLEVKA